MKNIINLPRSGKIMNCCTRRLLNIYESVKTGVNETKKMRLIKKYVAFDILSFQFYEF